MALLRTYMPLIKAEYNQIKIILNLVCRAFKINSDTATLNGNDLLTLLEKNQHFISNGHVLTACYGV